MRNFKDKTGCSLTVNSLSGDDSFAGIIEGSAYMLRRMRFEKAKREMAEQKGVLYWGLAELEREIKSLGKNTDIWPPRERWVAYVGTSEYLGPEGEIYHYEIKSLKITWYQDGGDPMVALQNIVGTVDFAAICATEITREYD